MLLKKCFSICIYEISFLLFIHQANSRFIVVLATQESMYSYISIYKNEFFYFQVRLNLIRIYSFDSFSIFGMKWDGRFSRSIANASFSSFVIGN